MNVLEWIAFGLFAVSVFPILLMALWFGIGLLAYFGLMPR